MDRIVWIGTNTKLMGQFKMNKLRHLVGKYGPEKLSDLIGAKLAPDKRVLSYELRANVAKSGFFKPEYSFDVPLSSTSVDFQGQRMSESFLKSIPTRVDTISGYYEEEHPEGFVRDSQPDFIMDNLRFGGGRLVGTVHVLRDGPNHDLIVKDLKKGLPKGVSIELSKALVADNDSLVVDAKGVNGFIITSIPANKDTVFKKRLD